MPKRIQLSRAAGWRLPSGAVRVDRATRFGNPYRVNEMVDLKQMKRWGWVFSPHGRHLICRSAEEAAARFRHSLLWDVAIHDFIREKLGGRDLACWCPLVDMNGKPVPCHADSLLWIANSNLDTIRAIHEEEDRKIMKETTYG